MAKKVVKIIPVNVGIKDHNKEFIKQLKIANEFAKIMSLNVDERGNILVDGLNRNMFDMMKGLFEQINDYADNDDEVSEFTIDFFNLDKSKIKNPKEFGKKINTYLYGVDFAIYANGGNINVNNYTIGGL
jgi:signal transduction histidine kinase